MAVRQLQRWAWERVGRGKLLLRCRLLGGARRFGADGEERGGAYRGGRPPTACFICNFFFMLHSHKVTAKRIVLMSLIFAITNVTAN